MTATTITPEPMPQCKSDQGCELATTMAEVILLELDTEDWLIEREKEVVLSTLPAHEPSQPLVPSCTVFVIVTGPAQLKFFITTGPVHHRIFVITSPVHHRVKSSWVSSSIIFRHRPNCLDTTEYRKTSGRSVPHFDT